MTRQDSRFGKVTEAAHDPCHVRSDLFAVTWGPLSHQPGTQLEAATAVALTKSLGKRPAIHYDCRTRERRGHSTNRGMLRRMRPPGRKSAVTFGLRMKCFPGLRGHAPRARLIRQPSQGPQKSTPAKRRGQGEQREFCRKTIRTEETKQKVAT